VGEEVKLAEIAYLAWLDAGNIGRHYEWQRSLNSQEG
jgi:hypothetical protein